MNEINTANYMKPVQTGVASDNNLEAAGITLIGFCGELMFG